MQKLVCRNLVSLLKSAIKTYSLIKKKDEVPNAIAVIARCFAEMNKMDVDYRTMIDDLDLKAKVKKGAGFAKKNTVENVNS